MKKIFLGLFFLVFAACAKDNQVNTDNTYQYCMDITHSSDVLICIIEVANQKEKDYRNAFDVYLKAINAPERRSYNKSLIASLANKARKSWDIYMKNECLAEASVYEKDSYGYNAAYNICLTIRYDSRIKYYKSKIY